MIRTILLFVTCCFAYCLIFPTATHAQSAALQTRLKQLVELETKLNEIQTSTTLSEKKKSIESADLLEWIAFRRSLIGDYSGAIKAFNLARPAKSEDGQNLAQTKQLLHDSTLSDALEMITKKVRDRQIVILNEAHHVPLHRAFALQLSRKLRAMGFEYLACETFASNVYFPFQTADVELYDGYYTQEPMFANFIRGSIKDKWKFVAYERERTTKSQPNENEKTREYIQASNLVKRILSENPKAKIFIYVGYGHASKFPRSTSDSDDSMLAAQLQRLTGIEPLTIDQATLYDQNRSEWLTGAYNEIVNKFNPITASVLVNRRNETVHIGVDPRAYDIQIVHPKYQIDPKTNREAWLNQLEDFKYFEIPADIFEPQKRAVIYAFSKSATGDIVPVDTVQIRPNEAIPKMILKDNDVKFVVETLKN